MLHPRTRRSTALALGGSILIALGVAWGDAGAQNRTARASFEVSVRVLQSCNVNATEQQVRGCEATVRDSVVVQRDRAARPVSIREAEPTAPASGAEQTERPAIRVRTVYF